MRSHEAGALHGQAGDRGPAWLRVPEDANELVPHLWAAGVSKVDGVLTVAGESAPDLAAEFGTPLYVLDEDDFRARARAFRDAFEGCDVFYAGKAFLCVATARWIAEEGLNLDVCTGGELAVALRAEFPPARIGLHVGHGAAQQDGTPIAARVDARRGWISLSIGWCAVGMRHRTSL